METSISTKHHRKLLGFAGTCYYKVDYDAQCHRHICIHIRYFYVYLYVVWRKQQQEEVGKKTALQCAIPIYDILESKVNALYAAAQ